MRVLFCIALLLVVSGAVVVTCPSNGYGCVTYGANIAKQTTRTNSLCRNGYYWNNQACMPCKNADAVLGGYYTCSAYYEATSLTCTSGYTLINGVCIPIPQRLYYLWFKLKLRCLCVHSLQLRLHTQRRYCSSWDENAVCTTCQTGYFLNWDLKFTLTTSGSNNQTDWITTWQTYYRFPGESFCSVCSQTMANCKSCNSAYTCSQCNDGYYWQQSTSSTQLTSSNAQFAGACVSCLTSGYCATQLVISQLKIQPTLSFYLVMHAQLDVHHVLHQHNALIALPHTTNITDNLCYPLNKCASINTQLTTSGANPKCSSCIAGYALDPSGSGICYQCGNCDSCTVPSGQQTAGLQTSCTTCWDTYYGVKDSNGIVTCKPCTQASDSFLRCQGPVENSSLTSVVPTQCQDGYYLYTLPAVGTTAAQTICVPSTQNLQCVTIVATSATQYTCATCTSQSKLYNNANCLVCNPTLTSSLPQGCTACSGSPSNSITCSACAVNYFYSTGTTTTCTACDQNCIQCGSGPTCTKCAITYYVSGAGCTQCGVANCATCTAQSPNTCQVCLDGYFLSSINTGTGSTSYCLKCPAECATCSAPGQVCNSCISGYVLSNGGCISLSQANCAEGYITSTLNNEQYPSTQKRMCYMQIWILQL
ncbi:unnamed protein product (macronuclear) [Paramecium tetraurelia]|uniref:TNFR-Cys domain-containing protein n=1 Tax=Paramecium tetraurelia TaxID=5888 RepID=A0BFM7_PARTE|nr:uncharacterized protein GSPATT00028379001 [Paramecium tetraurelia]CAK57344.1 unnamed protein product [Paramecium tetraurelia]|eukprot:XP_001424742.1 hypothetical protein (macronuclear) [Paramecium tetraurelia strain d4-2]